MCTVGVEETWRRLFVDILIKVTGLEATIACQDDQMCARLRAGIDGTFHQVQVISDENMTTRDYVFFS